MRDGTPNPGDPHDADNSHDTTDSVHAMARVAVHAMDGALTKSPRSGLIQQGTVPEIAPDFGRFVVA